MSRKASRNDRRGSSGGGGLGWSIFVKDSSGNPDVERVVLFYQTWGIADPPVVWTSIEESEPPTEAELYDMRNGLGRYWDPNIGHSVKPSSHPDFRIARDMAADIVAGVLGFRLLRG